MEFPRDYQFGLFQRAQQDNTIVVMATGMGKTMVALLLLKYVQCKDNTKVSFFLVPTVPLVEQQKNYLTTNSQLKVKGISGGTSSDNRANQRFEVIVMTPQIFLQALDHGWIKMEMINLIVFDECHHCRGNHPYNLIMTLHYFKADKSKCPLIFGMTASPHSGTGNIEAELRQLESNLDSTTITIESLGLLDDVATTPTERVVYYEPIDFYSAPKLYTKIASESQTVLEYCEKNLREALHFSDLLGPWCADRILEAALIDVKRRCKQIVGRRMLKILENDTMNNAQKDLNLFVQEYIENRELAQYFSDDDEIERPRNKKPPDWTSRTDPSDTCAQNGMNLSFDASNDIKNAPELASSIAEQYDADLLKQSVLELVQNTSSVSFTEVLNPVIDLNAPKPVNSTAAIETDSKKSLQLLETEPPIQSTLEEGEISESVQIERDFGEEGEITDDTIPALNTAVEHINATLQSMQVDNQGNVISFTNKNGGLAPRLKRKRVNELTESIISEIYSEMAPDDLDYQFKHEKKHYLDSFESNVLETIEDYVIQASKSESWGQKCSPPRSGELSAKLETLVDILVEFEANMQFCGIVFCQMKSVTIAVQHMIKAHPRLKFLRSAYLIGHDSSSRKNYSMAAETQASYVKRFLSGEINLLVATSVAEEGLDIKPCNCVVQFDFAEKTVTSYIQSRGRARHLTSQYIILAQKGDKSIQKLLQKLKESDAQIKKTIRTRSHSSTPRSLAKAPKVDIGPQFQTETGARVTYHNAATILNTYWASLNSELVMPARFATAQDKRGCACEIYFTSRYRHNYQKIRSGLKSSRKEAKADVIFKTVKLLYACGEIDDYLRPGNIRMGATERIQAKQRILAASRKGARYYDVAVPSALIENNLNPDQDPVLYLNVLTFVIAEKQELGTVGFTTIGHPGKAFDIPFNYQIAKEDFLITVTTLRSPIISTPELKASLQKFTFEFFKSTLKSPFEEKMDWLMYCFPINVDLIQSITCDSCPSDIIDWAAFDHCNASPRDTGVMKMVEDGDLLGVQKFCYRDFYHYNRIFLIQSITGKTPNSLAGSKGDATILDIYRSKFANSEQLAKDIEIDENQKIVYGKHLGYPYGGGDKVQMIYEADLIPQLLVTSPILSCHVVEALRLPFLIRHLQHRLLCQDLLDKKPFPERVGELETSIDLLQMAFTAPISGIYFNYESLETLGDSFLKAYFTIHLFATRAWQREGSLTKERQVIESNANLRSVANQLNLEGYVNSSQFSRKLYVPPNRTVAHKQKMVDKMVADVVESSIGACLVHGGERAASKCCVFFFGITFKSTFLEYYLLYRGLVDTTINHQFVKVKDSYEEIESLFGYKFRAPEILEEALTHPTAFPGTLKSYERLEFIGDSVLGLSVTKFLYNIENGLSCGIISEMRTAMVNNQFLGVVGITLGLPKLIHHQIPDLDLVIESWTNLVEMEVKKLKEQEFKPAITKITKSGEQTEYSPPFWQSMEVIPKIMGDLYESTLGAIFLDSHFDIEAVERAVTKTLTDAWWPVFLPTLKHLKETTRISSY